MRGRFGVDRKNNPVCGARCVSRKVFFYQESPAKNVLNSMIKEGDYRDYSLLIIILTESRTSRGKNRQSELTGILCNLYDEK